MPLRLDKEQICSTGGIPSKGLKDSNANPQPGRTYNQTSDNI